MPISKWEEAGGELSSKGVLSPADTHVSPTPEPKQFEELEEKLSKRMEEICVQTVDRGELEKVLNNLKDSVQVINV